MKHLKKFEKVTDEYYIFDADDVFAILKVDNDFNVPNEENEENKASVYYRYDTADGLSKVDKPTKFRLSNFVLINSVITKPLSLEDALKQLPILYNMKKFNI